MDILESIAGIVKYLISSNFVNFLIMVILLYFLVKKFNLVAFVNKGIDDIKNNISDAEQTKVDALNSLNISKSDLEQLPVVLKEISDASELRANFLIDNIETSAKKSVDAFCLNSEKQIAFEEKKLSSEILSKTLKTSVSRAQNDIVSMLNSDINLHYKLIDECINDLEKVKL